MIGNDLHSCLDEIKMVAYSRIQVTTISGTPLAGNLAEGTLVSVIIRS